MDDPTDPELTVVIPTRNRRRLVLALIASLLPEVRQLSKGSGAEVVVVMDGPEDDTPAALAEVAAGPDWADLCLRPMTQPWAGAAAARNTGLRSARGRFVVFLDDDALAQPGLLAAHLTRQRSAGPGGQVVVGHIVNQPGPGALASAVHDWWLGHYRRLAESGAPQWTAFYTGNVSVGREAAIRAGGFDPLLPYAEDAEFGYRLSVAGQSFVYAPEAAAVIRNWKPPAAILHDFTRSGRASVLIARKSPGTLRNLPLAAAAQGSLKLRLARRSLLAVNRVPCAGRLIDAVFLHWAALPPAYVPRSRLELGRSFYYWRGVRDVATPEEWRQYTSPGAVVLMYHSVAPAPRGDRYTVSPRALRLQLAILRLLRRGVVDLETLLDHWDAGRAAPPRSVALTFDDGYRDNLVHAWPLLRPRGLPATLFVVTGHVGGDNAWDAGPSKPLLSWRHIRAFDVEGFRAGSHTVTHPDLRDLTREFLTTELQVSRSQLEAHLGRPVRLLAYPYGGHNEDVDAAAEAAGYRAGFSARAGVNSLATRRWDYRRTEIRGTDGLLRFTLKILIGHDPLPGLWRRLTSMITSRTLRNRVRSVSPAS